jgi:hypothetical protein
MYMVISWRMMLRAVRACAATPLNTGFDSDGAIACGRDGRRRQVGKEDGSRPHGGDHRENGSARRVEVSNGVEQYGESGMGRIELVGSERVMAPGLLGR